MSEGQPQTYENHVRLDPVFHFFLVPLSAATFLTAAWNVVRRPDLLSICVAVGTFLFVVAVVLIRIYALRVQDRVIRLEERLRLATLLPESQRTRIGELSTAQLVALRFASDSEVSALAMKALDERLAPAEIKKSIQLWRADTLRV